MKGPNVLQLNFTFHMHDAHLGPPLSVKINNYNVDVVYILHGELGIYVS